MDTSLRGWAWLPAHIVDLMVIKLDRLSDYMLFCGVCPQWRYVAFESNVDHKVNLDVLKTSRKKLPMLMLKTDENTDEYRNLYSVSNGKTYTVRLPLPYRKRFAGSSCGWLFCVDENCVVTLVNPYNTSCISLPVLRDPREMAPDNWYGSNLEYYIIKGILLLDPLVNPDSFEVVVIYGGSAGKLAFFKSGKPSWKIIHSPITFGDVVSYKEKVYGISKSAQFVEIDLQNGIIKNIIPEPARRPKVFLDEVYLVESQHDDLLMVTRRWDLLKDYVEGSNEFDSRVALFTPNRSFEFKVFKITHPIEEGSTTWIEIKNIGQQTVFLGDNHSVSVSTSEFPRCQPNSLYYTSQFHLEVLPYGDYGPDEDSGIFDLEDGSFNLEDGKFYNHHSIGSSYKYVQPPIWFLPNPQEIN